MKISVSEEAKDNAKWRLGDVIADNSYSEIYLIVKDNNGDIVAMGLDKQDSSAYRTEDPWYGPSDSIDDLEADFAIDGDMVHKVNARLDIKKPVIDEEEEKKMMIETGITSEEWNIGDVIVSEKKQGIALIVKDNAGFFCAMDIDALDKSVTTYSTEDNAVYYCGGQGYFNKLGMMQSYFASEGWHKAKAVLKVYSNIELGGDKDGKQ
ncbi:hypothetical protein [Lactobacillus amylovorus]|uniref:hypothetical protein n=1 Tax=Lactobacillus amylovorus TaxID=1604 RepID=UPI003D001709